MSLVELLQHRRESILDEWFNALAESYPLDTSTHLKNQLDQFQNPVGHTFKRCLPILLDALCNAAAQNGLDRAIDDLVKIRTVQANAPSQAVAFVFLIKNIVRKQLRAELAERQFQDELCEFEARVDGLALMFFDQYMRCRETILGIRATEERMRTAKLLEQVNKRYGNAAASESKLRDRSKDA